MKRLYTFMAAMALTASAFAQNHNLYNAADVDQDGWLWFDTQAKIDKYVGEADNDEGSFKPLEAGGKLIQLCTTDYAPYEMATADANVWGFDAKGEADSLHQFRHGGILLPRGQSLMNSRNGGRVLFYMPSCKQFDLAFTSEFRLKIQVAGTSNLKQTTDQYTTLVAGPILFMQGQIPAGIQTYANIQTKAAKNGFKLEGNVPVVASIQNCGVLEPMIIQGVRVFTQEETTLGVKDVQTQQAGLRVMNGSAYTNHAADIYVYDMAGHMVASAKQATQLDLMQLAKGVYVVKAGKQSRKVVVD